VEGDSSRLALEGLEGERPAGDVELSVGRLSKAASAALRSTLETRGSTTGAVVIAVKGVMVIFLEASVVCGRGFGSGSEDSSLMEVVV
jgi:hypothetical protein